MQQGSMELLWRTSHIHGGNATYVEDLYEAYLMDPNAVPGEWRSYFDTLPRVNGGKLADVPHSTVRERFAQISRMRVRTEATVGVNAAFFTEYRGSADDSGDSGPSLMEIIFHGAIQQAVQMMLGGTDSGETGGKHANGAATRSHSQVRNNEAGIETLGNLPKNPRVIYEKGRKLAAAQDELSVDGRVTYNESHAFCPKTCNTGTIRYRSSIQEGIKFLKENPHYGLLLGSYEQGAIGRISIYPAATVSRTIRYPFGTPEYRNYSVYGGPEGIRVTGAESVLGVIAHETGHRDGTEHGPDMRRREYDAIMRAR